MFKCSNLQMVKSSNLQMFQWVNWVHHKVRFISMFQGSNVPMFQCSNVQMFKCSNVQMFKCSNIQMFKCSNVQMFKCSNFPMLKCSNVHMLKSKIFKYSNVQMSIKVKLLSERTPGVTPVIFIWYFKEDFLDWPCYDSVTSEFWRHLVFS